MLLHALCEYTRTGVSREHEMRAIVKGLKVGESFISKLQKPITLVSNSVECIKIATGQHPDFDGSEDFNLLAKEAQLLYFKLSQANKVKLTMRHTIRDDNKLADALNGFALHTMETEGIESQVFANFLPEGSLKQTYEGDLRHCMYLKHIHRLVGLHVKRDRYGGSRRLDREIGILNLHHQQMLASRMKFGDRIEEAQLPPKSYRGLEGALHIMEESQKGKRFASSLKFGHTRC